MESLFTVEGLMGVMGDNQPTLLTHEIKLSQEMQPQMGLLRMKCLICDHQLHQEVSFNVFSTALPKSGVPLSNSLNKVLKTNYQSFDTLRSTVLCNICFNLFDELEVAEEQCRTLRITLISGFRKTCELYGQLVEDTTCGVACQTDVSVDDLLLNVKEEVIPVKPKQERRVRKAKTKMKRKPSRSKETSSEFSEEENFNGEKYNDNPDNDNQEHFIDFSDPVKPDPDTTSDCPTDKPTGPKRKYTRKKYTCDYCTRLFRRPGEVKNHVLVKHLGKNPNQCTFCEKKFNSRNGLYVHLKRVHNVEYSERIELVSNIPLDEDITDAALLVDKALTIKPKESEQSSQSEDEGMEEGGRDSSGSEWTEETESRKRKRSASTSKDNKGCRKEKENLGSRSNNPSRKVVTVKYLSEDGIGEEKYVLKEDEGDGVGDKVEQGQEGETRKTGGEGEKRKDRRKRVRPSRVGERACMPLIHECPTCGKKWRTVSELNAHIQTHSDLRPFVCEICGQGYKMKKALLVHVGMHSGIHPFTCHFCNKSFTQKIGLVKHLNIHNGTKKYQCHLCGKSFIHHTSYKFHQLVHSGERNVKCDICGLALTTKSHLNRHMLVHTGDRPHECSVCGKRFAKKWNAQVHKKKVHGLDVPGTTHRVMPVPPIGGGEKEEDVAVMIKQRLMQKCQMCSFKSSRKESLQEHWEREHNRFLNTYTGEYEEYAM
ncbi:hypothetical protein M8J76_015856 [Diaphorina citri]|nr:hypothetical protein M8J76_015856 [Diaphorina citri]